MSRSLPLLLNDLLTWLLAWLLAWLSGCALIPVMPQQNQPTAQQQQIQHNIQKTTPATQETDP